MFYTKCLKFPTAECAKVVEIMARRRDGAKIHVVENVMYFYDKFTFDHIDYHYRMKISGDQKPEIIDSVL